MVRKLSVLLLALVFVFGCGPTGEDAKIVAVIKANLKAANDEDLPGYMFTLDKQSPLYAPTEVTMKQLFDIGGPPRIQSGLKIGGMMM